MKYFNYCYLLLLIACAGNHQQMEVDNKQDTAQTVVESTVPPTDSNGNEFALQTLTSLPKSASGCRGLFATDTTALQNKEYVFASNIQGKAYIKINGRIVVLKLDDKIEDGSLIKEIYKGNGFMMHVVLHKVRKTGKEAWLYAGELLLLKNDQQESKSIVGEVGC